MALFLLSTAFLVVPILSVPLATRTSNSTILWTDCSHKPWLPQNLQCANMTLPVDWDAPKNGDTLYLNMVKLLRPSNTTSQRIGHLFINPGGPGGQAVVTVAEIARGWRNVSSEILNSFDIIGVDPRGVGSSSSTDCDPEIWNERVSLFPKTEEEYERLVDKNKRLGESCLKRTGPLFNHLDTISTVKDLEAIRVALGDGEKLNWLGLSYGTQIGSQYAQLFPDNIRAMVLDGVLQHSQADSSNILIETTTYAAELKSFFAWAGIDDASPLKGQDVEKLWYKILETASNSPIPSPNCQTSCRKDVTDEEIRLNAQGLLLTSTTSARTRFANALLQASQGDASLLATPTEYDGNPSLYPGIAIGCQDWAARRTSFADLQAKMRIGETLAPLTKGASQTWTLQASCIGWPAPLANPPSKLNIETQSPILLVNAVQDPSTSYVWAVGMLEEIENSNNVLLTRNGHGHTSWGDEGATTDAINRFLLTTKLPAKGTVLDS